MKGERLLRSLARLAVVAAMILLYLLLYLFPAVVEVNRGKRTVKDLQRQLAEIRQTSHTITEPGRGEREIWRSHNRRFAHRMPVRTSTDPVDASLCGWLRSPVKGEGIESYVLVGGDRETVLCRSVGGETGELFPLWKQSGADPAGLVLRDGAAYSIYSEYLEPAPFYLGLRAWVRDASRLLSGLTALPFHFEIAEARIFAGETAPLVLIGLRTYLRDENWDGRVDTAGIGFERFIDVNSPLLLVPVEPLPNNKPDERRSLPDWKRILFRK